MQPWVFISFSKDLLSPFLWNYMVDKKNEKEERIMVFIDGSNVYHIIKSLLSDKKQFDFNFEKVLNHLIGKRKLIRFYYYNAPLFVLCRMQKRKINDKTICEVKEDDIRLAVDMVKLAYNNAYDTAILISSDGDFVPAIQAVKEIGKNVENISFEESFFD